MGSQHGCRNISSRQLGEVVSNGNASSQELANTMKMAGEHCCKTDEASLSLEHLPPRVDRHDVLANIANMFRNPTKQRRMNVDAYMCLNVDFQTSNTLIS